MTVRMMCLVGGFSWNLSLDGYCPNHGTIDRWDNKRGPANVMCDENGPYDPKTGASYLDCCSVPENEEDVTDA